MDRLKELSLFFVFDIVLIYYINDAKIILTIKSLHLNFSLIINDFLQY